LDHFLFGQAAALLVSDVVWMAGLGGVALLCVLLFWKEFKLLSFDREFGASLGLPMVGLDIFLITLLVAAIVIGLQAVGVVLMSALLIAPAAAARQWTDRLGVMVALSGFFGALAGVIGAVISSLGRGLSTGPVVVLCASVIVLISLTLAPNRGLVWSWVRNRRSRRALRAETVLADLYTLAAQHADWQHPHSIGALRAMNFNQAGVGQGLETLEQRGWVRRAGSDEWSLTAAGADEARRLARQGAQE
jgi:manganese/zinc/iron transport system permease protein